MWNFRVWLCVYLFIFILFSEIILSAEKIIVRMVIFDDFWNFWIFIFDHYCIGLDSKMKILFCEIFEISFRLTQDDLWWPYYSDIAYLVITWSIIWNHSECFCISLNLSEYRFTAKGRRGHLRSPEKKRPQR